mmetsp:Transcript_87140/g.255044  ORF Transcript_87140/g.255044 Transcript_87140/m.255044 type:complete len:107 (-) Transcript_87140:59-379(-)
MIGQVVGPPAVLPGQLPTAGKGFGGIGGLLPMPTMPTAMALDPTARGRGSAMAAWPLAPGAAVARPPQVIRPEAVGKGRGAPGPAVQMPPVKSLIEEDIHSKLLGL